MTNYIHQNISPKDIQLHSLRQCESANNMFSLKWLRYLKWGSSVTRLLVILEL